MYLITELQNVCGDNWEDWKQKQIYNYSWSIEPFITVTEKVNKFIKVTDFAELKDNLHFSWLCFDGLLPPHYRWLCINFFPSLFSLHCTVASLSPYSFYDSVRNVQTFGCRSTQVAREVWRRALSIHQLINLGNLKASRPMCTDWANHPWADLHQQARGCTGALRHCGQTLRGLSFTVRKSGPQISPSCTHAPCFQATTLPFLPTHYDKQANIK